jgi:DegV family protein with EDD domain
MAATQAVRESSSVLFTVGTLEYLHRGGRIGGAARLFGTALNLKPLLTIEDGRVEVLQKIRSQRKALRRMLNVMEERLSGRRPTAVGVIDVDAVEEADDLAAAVVERFNPARLYRTTVTPVIGAHAGPGTLGIGFYV